MPTSARRSSARPRRPRARPTSACWSTASPPSANRASRSISPGATSTRRSRRLVIIDSPGHEQYTRNMATGASHADVAILLVDARGGVKEQTRRHAAILDLMGVRKVVLAVNKMDLVGWSAERVSRRSAAISMQLAARFGFEDAVAIPVSAVLGDNIARRSPAMPWYDGAPLLDASRPHAVAQRRRRPRQFRFPVQLVVRAGQDFRGLAGTVTSGSVAVGDEVVEPVTARRARVRRIVTMGRDLSQRGQGRPSFSSSTTTSTSRAARRCWCRATARRRSRAASMRGWCGCRTSLSPRERGYLLRTATDLIPIAGDHHHRAPRSRNNWPRNRPPAAPPTTSRSAASSLADRAASILFADQPEQRQLHAGRSDHAAPPVAGGVVSRHTRCTSASSATKRRSG